MQSYQDRDSPASHHDEIEQWTELSADLEDTHRRLDFVPLADYTSSLVAEHDISSDKVTRMRV